MIPPADFGFVVHPLTPWQLRLLGLRSADRALLAGQPSTRGARIVSTLRLEAPGAPRPLRGVLVGIPWLTDALLADQAAGVDAVAEAVRLCHAAGARVVGLGAVAAVIGGQGKAVAQAVPEVAVTTGNAVTALAAVETVMQWRQRVGDRGPVGLLGPPGPVANAILSLLTDRGVQVRVVSPKPPTPLRRLADEINQRGYGHVSFVEHADAVLGAGQVLVAASSTGGRLRRSALPSGSVVVDVAAPQDVLLDGSRRADILILDGEYVRLPTPLAGSPWQTLYRWVTRQSQHIFGCFAEPMVLALADRPDLASVGRSVPRERLRAIGQLLDTWGMVVDGVHADGRPLRAGRRPPPRVAAAEAGLRGLDPPAR